MIRLALAALCLVALVACARTTPQLSAADDGRTVEIGTGDRVAVALEANPSTGFAWVVSESAPGTVWEAGAPSFAASSNALGASGTMTFSYEGAKAGETTLTFAYRRSFEPNVAPERTFTVTVRVR